jgi:L-threonylcarbamoyladenylate synthase
MARVLRAEEADTLALAARRLAEGGLVAFPTETVYGLGARADDASAVAAIFEAKGRPKDHPLIVHVADLAHAHRYVSELPPVALRLIAAFWPGPLTVIVPRRPGIGEAAAGGQDSIGLRCPSHPVALALLRAAHAQGVSGVAAPSANRFGRVSPTLAAHVHDEFPDRDDLLVVDGGPCEVGIESCIVDCSRGRPVLLRPGGLPRERLEQVAGEPLADRDDAAPRASGTLAAHYAPQAVVRLMDAAALRQALGVMGADLRAAGVAVYSRTVTPPPACPQRRMPDDAAAAARELFAALRGFDAAGARLLWVETPPESPEWDGVRDRLTRAAAAA